MDPQAALQVLTEACHELADSNSQRAHAVLQDFRDADRPYELLKYAIEHGEPVVQFHAVTALRDAAMREFDHGLTQSEKLSLVEWLLSKSLTVSGLVRRQMSGSMALILKRMWGTLDAARKEGLLRHVAEAGDTELMQAIVVEFNPYTTSAIGVMSWEYHYACKLDLEASFLPQILSWTLECVRGSDPARVASSLRLLSALLLWDHNTSYIKGAVVELSVRPPENWREILLSMDAGLYGVMEGVRGRVSAGTAGDVAISSERQAYLQVVNNLASMHGRIFGDERGPGGHKVQHVAHMLKLLLPELLAMQQFSELGDQVAYLNSHSEMLLGACRALSSMCGTHSLKDVVGALRCLSTQDASIPPAAILGTLGNCAVVSLRGSIGNETSDAAEECADIMLDVWTELSSDYDVAAHLGPDLYPQFSSCAGAVFATYLEKQLHTAAMEAFEDEEDFEGEEEAYVEAVLSGLASVARASHSISLPNLAESLERSKQKLHEAVAKGSDASVPLEELCWMLRMSSYVMADSGDGETPLVPQIFAEGMSAGGINASPLVSMSQTLIKLATDFKASIDTAVASSRLMEELCKALGRWSETYLIPDGDGSSGPLSSDIDWTGYIFSVSGEGPAVLNFLVELVHLCFAKFPGDRNLHLIATQNLLKPLTKYPRVHGVLSRTYSWQDLYKSYVQESEATKNLEAEVQMHLTAAICNGYGTQAPDCVRELVAWQVKRLCHCASLPKNEFERADRVALTCNVLSSLRGAARAGCGLSRPLIFGEMRPCIPATLDVLGKSKEYTIVYNNVLELAADIFEFHTPYLSDEDSRGLFSWAVELIRRHCADKVLFNAKNGLLTSSKFDNECDSLLSIIRLLTQVTNTDLRHDDVAATVFSGVETIMPLMTGDHLKVPPLRRAFFYLLTYMVEAYASKVADLSPQSFVSFLQAMAFGLQVQEDSETGSAVFEAIAAFAKHGVMCRMRGGQALGANEETMIDGKRPLVFLFDSIVSKVILEDGANSLDMASEPMLYIMAQDATAFAEHLKAHIGPGDARAAGAIDELAVAASAAVATSLDRSSRQGFSAVFKSTIGNLRGLRKK